MDAAAVATGEVRGLPMANHIGAGTCLVVPTSDVQGRPAARLDTSALSTLDLRVRSNRKSTSKLFEPNPLRVRLRFASTLMNRVDAPPATEIDPFSTVSYSSDRLRILPRVERNRGPCHLRAAIASCWD